MCNLADNEYRCARCGGVFEKGWTDDDAQTEREANGWAGIPDEDMEVVCEDCYNEINRARARWYGELS